MAQTLEQKTNNDGFPKPDHLIELRGHHELEAMDRVIFNLLYQHAHDSGRLGDPLAEWEIDLVDLRPSKHESNDRIRDALRRLRKVEVLVPYVEMETGEERTIITGLFDFFDVSDAEATTRSTVRYGLPKKLGPILARSNRWGRIKAEVCMAMTSKYAIALYEMLALRQNMTKFVEVFPVDRFRELIGVPPGKLVRGPDFVRYVVEIAELEVNGLSDLGCKIELRRKGDSARGSIVSVAVAWWRKTGPEFVESMSERRRSKVGRMARLKGTVEQVENRQIDLEGLIRARRTEPRG